MKDTILRMGGFALLAALAIGQQLSGDDPKTPNSPNGNASGAEKRVQEMEEDLADGYRAVFQAKGANPEELRSAIDSFERLNRALTDDLAAEKHALAASAPPLSPAPCAPVSTQSKPSSPRTMASFCNSPPRSSPAGFATPGTARATARPIPPTQRPLHEKLREANECHDGGKRHAGWRENSSQIPRPTRRIPRRNPFATP